MSTGRHTFNFDMIENLVMPVWQEPCNGNPAYLSKVHAGSFIDLSQELYPDMPSPNFGRTFCTILTFGLDEETARIQQDCLLPPTVSTDLAGI